MDTAADFKWLKKAIWAYFLLLIFEGALRKWFLPGLATPLLIVRDPIAMWLVYEGWQRNLFPSTIYLKGMVIIGLISIYLAVVAGHGNVIVAIYGARIFLIHFPLIFLIGRVFDREDILQMGRVTLYIALPMLILISMQFYSPQSAWVNRGIGGDMEGAGFSGSGDFKRPPGTFSFTNGTALYFGWLAPFVLYFWFHLKKVNIWLLISASGAMLIAIPFSISRTLFFEVSLTVAFAVIASVRKPENFTKVVIAGIAGIIVLGILSQTEYFTTATGAFFDRFDTANEQEGGLVKGVIGDRFFGGLFTALEESSDQPFWGYGVGLGTNVGSMLLSNTRMFLLSEGEWGRLIGEVGPLLGLTIVFMRVGLALKLTWGAYKKLAQNDFLPWLLLSFAFINIIMGSWAQPTALGFGIVIAGLLVASLKPEPEPDTDTDYEDS
ncbi:hypothetical protein [Mucilaginibacter gynuensis]